jgi:hypothetical protein
LPAVATAAVPVYTEGNQVALSVDLAGQLRTVAGGELSADIVTWDNYKSQAVFDPMSRRLLELIWVKVSDLYTLLAN